MKLILPSVNGMKKKPSEGLNDDLRPHYELDYSKMKPNRFAKREKVYRQTFVALDEDVSEVFQTSEAVNAVLRSAIRTGHTATAEEKQEAEQAEIK